jgi:uncharacterized cupredoxin-like copper-binding protein
MWRNVVNRSLFSFLILAILGVLLSACGFSTPQKVEVLLTEFGIESSTSIFKVGQAYQFVITNAGALNHEFTIMPPLGDLGMPIEEHEPAGDEHNMEGALLHVGEDQLPPGATVTVEVKFGTHADLEFACHLAGHYEGGMSAPITLEH